MQTENDKCCPNTRTSLPSINVIKQHFESVSRPALSNDANRMTSLNTAKMKGTTDLN